jgi:hypothetical protein
MMSHKCKANSASGTPCGIKAGPSGYCHIHDPQKIADRAAAQKAAEETRQEWVYKSARLMEVIKIVEATGKAKGWTTTLLNLDKINGRYGSISVTRYVPTDFGRVSVNGLFDINLTEDGVRMSPHSTSTHVRDLQAAIMEELRRLPWIESPRKSTQDKQPQTELSKVLQQVELLIKRFHIAARQLTYRYKNRETLVIKDEYDVQDLLHVLLKAVFEDVRSEEHTPSYAGAASRIDFLLKNEKIVIEAKMTRDKLRDKETGEQLIIDIKRYQAHPDCETLVCFVYDPGGFIKNPTALENDLSRKHDDLDVKVFVVPH